MTARILSTSSVSEVPTVITAPDRQLDDATRGLIARERAEAHAEGLRAGLEQARRETAAVTAALGRARDEVVDEVHRQQEVLAAALAERVLAATAAILGREPDDEGRALVERLRGAVAGLDDPSVTVAVAAERHAVVAAALADQQGVGVVVDHSLGLDEARLTGEFAAVDLRVPALLAALDDVLADAGSLGPLVTEPDAARPDDRRPGAGEVGA